MPLTVEPYAMIIASLISGSRTLLSIWILLRLSRAMSPLPPSSQSVMTSRDMTMFFSLLPVAPILAFNGLAGILLVIQSLLAGNPRLMFIIP